MAKKKGRKQKNTAKQAESIDRRIEALRYRIAGYTFDQIGEAMGIKRTRAFQLVSEEVNRRQAERSDLANELRLVITERYERLTNRLWLLACPPIPEGETEAPPPDLPALDRLIRIQDHLCKIHGVEEPKRILLDIRTADALMMKLANISMRYIPDDNRAAYLNEVRSLSETVEREQAGRIGADAEVRPQGLAKIAS